jgi:hypothetical protein
MFSFKTHPSYSLWISPECPLHSACSLARLNSRTNQISRPHQKHQCRSVRKHSGPYLVQNSQSTWALEIKTRLWNPCTKIWSRIWWRSKGPRILLCQWKTRLTRTMKQNLMLVLAIEIFVQPRFIKTGSTDKKTVKNMTKLRLCLGSISSRRIDGIMFNFCEI